MARPPINSQSARWTPATADRQFYYLGSIIAVLALGAMAHGEIRWLHLYYTYNLIPSAALGKPLQKHKLSVLRDLQRTGRAALYQETLDALARDLQEACGLNHPSGSFKSGSRQVLKECIRGETSLLSISSCPGDAAAYVRGYLDQRRMPRPKRPAAPLAKEALEYCWQYHLGRTITWNGAGNDPHLSEAFQLGLKYKRELCKNGKKR